MIAFFRRLVHGVRTFVIPNYQYLGRSLLYQYRISGRGMLRKLTFARAVNVLRAIVEWKLGRAVVRSRPFAARIEVSAVCNLACPPCITPIRVFPEGHPRRLTMEKFRHIYDQLARAAMRVTFYIIGEPMTNPQLFDMVSVANRAGAFTSFSTNFTLMKESLLEPMCKSGLDFISVCLDGFSQEAYETYRVRGKVDAVKNGITMLMDYKRQHGYERPFVNVYTITFNHVRPELPAIEEFCRDQGVDRHTLRPDELGFDGSHNETRTPLPTSQCFHPYLVITVDADGTVYPCGCAPTHPYGNLHEQTLEEIWNGPMFVETRKYLSGQSEKREDLDLPCYTCGFFSRCPKTDDRIHATAS